MARSTDGLRFTPDPEPFADGGSSPDVERLEDGELVAVFDAPTQDDHKATTLTLLRSKDGGRTWSKPERVELGDSALGRRRARHGDLVFEPDGSLRLYFAALPPQTARSRSQGPPVIRSATLKDGARFRLDRQVALRCRGMIEPVPCIVADKGRRVMLLSDAVPSSTKERGEKNFTIRRAVSRDRGPFVWTAPVKLDDDIQITSIVALDDGFRAYGWNDDGIVSFRSGNLREWDVEKGVRLTGAWDPAVVRLKNGTYLMIYNAGPRPAPPAPPIAEGSLPFTLPDGEPGGEELLSVIEGNEPPMEDDELDLSGLAPQPDFAEPVDYSKWYREHALEPTDDNAYDAYLAFMPKFDEEGVPDREDWPEFKDMFNGGEYEGPPKPWKPEEQPDWEETHKNVKDVLVKFRDANLRTGYATRFEPTPDASPAGADEDRLLISLLLPSLSPYRTLSKATLADAWRAESKEKPSAERMIDAWKTVLRGAEHMDSGATLIESLVGTAVRNHTEVNARWALKHGVFDAKQLEQALDALRQYDGERRGPSQWIRGEHAAALDMTQYVFSPPGPDGQPTINLERIKRLSGLFDEVHSIDEFEGLGPEDARAAIDAFNDYYREAFEQLRVGYPEVRAGDLEATESRFVGRSPLTRWMIPSFSRYHALRARAEASRRATQLAYAVHIHHAHTGKWPRSLDELPSEVGDHIRTDPFTGRHFGYRVGKEGPTIYSASENGIDDGGVHAPRWNDEITNTAGSDDYVFWPPQK